MVEIDIPYKDTVQYSRVKLHSRQLNSELYSHLKKNLVDKVENKCNHNGYIQKVHKVTTYTNGVINCEDASSSVIFDVEYHARLWIPKMKTHIVGKITLINQTMIRIQNGPIIVYVTSGQINNKNFSLDSSFIIHKKTSLKLGLDDYVIVEIKQSRINYGESQINTVGYLFDSASKDEINKYYDEPKNPSMNELTV
jgi:DNA-directed RNA polymerase subunit E'/Rpb7